MERVLEPSPENAFLEDFRQFQAPIARAGMWNSISQLLLKIASPGVPDFYQGNELWAFDLVDPDNRAPVNYELRRQLLAKLHAQSRSDAAALMDQLVEHPCDGAIKLHVTSRALKFRQAHRRLFAEGSYIPMQLLGSRGRHAIAFARASGNEVLLALAGRFFLKLRNSNGNPVGETVWTDTRAVLPKQFQQRRFEDVLTGQVIEAQKPNGNAVIPLARVPVRLLGFDHLTGEHILKTPLLELLGQHGAGISTDGFSDRCRRYAFQTGRQRGLVPGRARAMTGSTTAAA